MHIFSNPATAALDTGCFVVADEEGHLRLSHFTPTNTRSEISKMWFGQHKQLLEGERSSSVKASSTIAFFFLVVSTEAFIPEDAWVHLAISFDKSEGIHQLARLA